MLVERQGFAVIVTPACEGASFGSEDPRLQLRVLKVLGHEDRQANLPIPVALTVTPRWSQFGSIVESTTFFRP